MESPTNAYGPHSVLMECNGTIPFNVVLFLSFKYVPFTADITDFHLKFSWPDLKFTVDGFSRHIGSWASAMQFTLKSFSKINKTQI